MSKDSPFFDHAETHTYSDWLMPACFEMGYDDSDEFYPGGLPDLSDYLDKSTPAPAFPRSWKELKLSRFGRKLKRYVKGRDWIDLGSGLPSYSPVPRLVAHWLEARSYTGYDPLLSGSIQIPGHPQSKSQFKAVYLYGKIPEIFSQINSSRPKLISLFGLEWQNAETQRIDEFWDQLCTALGPKDFVLIGNGCPDLQQPKSLKLRAVGHYHRLYSLKKKSKLRLWLSRLSKKRRHHREK
jgi:hypothetical protein